MKKETPPFQNKKLTALLFAGTTIIALLGIFLPGILMNRSSMQNVAVTSVVPTKYYSSNNSVIARNASSQLTDFEKIELISGVWDSNIYEADLSESGVTENDAVTMAKNGMKTLYKYHWYPVDFTSSFRAWYTPSAKLYRAVDTSFNTYTAYFWCVTFYRYDNPEFHQILMTEKGTILAAYTNAEYALADYNPVKNPPRINLAKHNIRIDCPHKAKLPFYDKIMTPAPSAINYCYMETDTSEEIQSIPMLYQVKAQNPKYEVYYIYTSCHRGKEPVFLYCRFPY